MDDIGRRETSARGGNRKMKESDLLQKIKATELKEQRSIGNKELAEEFGIPRSQIKKIRRKLVEQKKIKPGQ